MPQRKASVNLVRRDRRAVLPSGWSVTLKVPVKVYSTANAREHWAVKHRRGKEQKTAVQEVWGNSPLAIQATRSSTCLPLVVTLTNLGKPMDGHDNLPNSFKAIVDQVAALLGIDDGDERIEWRYEQKAGKGGVEITIESK